ncbi:MAG: hypothetical protein ACM3PY_00845 [Omnitrophica WOR_2 bacterium]
MEQPSIQSTPASLPMRRILNTWWPLAASWLLMGAELPALSAVVARLPNPEINLAAYGGIVNPLALIIESPIIMLLAASTALSKDWASYRKLHRFMMATGAALTFLHILVAFTPLYSLVAVGILGAPKEIIEPGRTGLMILLPWTWSIAYRRFNQGVLIRFGHSRAVGIGTVIRLSADALVLTAGYLVGTVPGIVVAAGAVSAGVLSEAIYAGLVVRPVIRNQLKFSPVVTPPLTLNGFLSFYFPLVMTSLLSLIVNPIGSAALSRMPNPLESLAAWPVVTGLLFMFRSPGIAYNEVVVALLDEPGSYKNLRRFTWILAVFTVGILLIMAATPLSRFWFQVVSALDAHLVTLALIALWISVPIPGLNALQSWYQGSILYSRNTVGITQAVIVFLVACASMLGAGVAWARAPGIYIAMATFGVAILLQTAWLWRKSRPVMKTVYQRDAVEKFK